MFGVLALAACSVSTQCAVSRAPIFQNVHPPPDQVRKVPSQTAAEFFEFLQTRVTVAAGEGSHCPRVTRTFSTDVPKGRVSASPPIHFVLATASVQAGCHAAPICR